MSGILTVCPISGEQTQEGLTDGDYRDINCPKCGSYKISGTLSATLPGSVEIGIKERALLSHYIRVKNEAGEQPFFRGNLIDQIVKEHSLPKPGEQSDNLILYIGRNTTAGKISQFDLSTLTAISGAFDNANLMFIGRFLLQQKYIISAHQEFIVINDKVSIGLDMRGWNQYYELEQRGVDRRLAFMAMPFGDMRLDEIYLKWFKPACEAVGYELRKVDEKPKAGIINNKMMVDIRKSSFVIAELTDENRGVYWESGFAEGLNRPVFYTCDQAYKDKLAEEGKSIHFDIRQHHTVFWTDTTLRDAAKRLVVTIQATIPEAKMVDVDAIIWPEDAR